MRLGAALVMFAVGCEHPAPPPPVAPTSSSCCAGDDAHGLATTIQPLLHRLFCSTHDDALIKGSACQEVGSPNVSLVLRERDSALDLAAVILFEHLETRRLKEMWKLVDEATCP